MKKRIIMRASKSPITFPHAEMAPVRYSEQQEYISVYTEEEDDDEDEAYETTNPNRRNLSKLKSLVFDAFCKAEDEQDIESSRKLYAQAVQVNILYKKSKQLQNFRMAAVSYARASIKVDQDPMIMFNKPFSELYSLDDLREIVKEAEKPPKRRKRK
jgi:hypothetical protein